MMRFALGAFVAVALVVSVAGLATKATSLIAKQHSIADMALTRP